MQMKEMVATPPTQLHLPKDHMTSSNCSTPYMSAATSPQRPRQRPRPPQLDFFFYSAPTSPRSSSSYLDDHFSYLDEDVAVLDRDYATDHVPLLSHRPSSSATVPFNWELKPGVAKAAACSNDIRNEDGNQSHKLGGKEQGNKDEFEFDFSGQLDMMVRPSLSSADELFDGGKIRPLKLKPPPRLHITNNNNNHTDNRIGSDSHSPKSPTSKFKDALRRKGSEKQDPFEAALRNTRKSDSGIKEDDNVSQDRGRGRGRVNTNTNTNMSTSTSKRGGSSGRKGISRSLSPLRVSEFALLQHQQYLEDQKNTNETSNSNCSRLLGRIPSSSTCSSKKWKLKDLLLFRSASEGHYKDTQSFSKRWSFRSSTAIGSGSGSVTDSGSGSVSKRTGQGASAHEMHYATNKAASEEMKRKTSLPYKHGLLACLGFSPILPQFSYTFPSPPSTPLSY